MSNEEFVVLREEAKVGRIVRMSNQGQGLRRAALVALAEECTTNTYKGCTFFDRDFEVVAHTDREVRQGQAGVLT